MAVDLSTDDKMSANIHAYEAAFENLRKHYWGKFVVFHDCALAGVFDDVATAADFLMKSYPENSGALLRQVGQPVRMNDSLTDAVRRMRPQAANPT